METINYQGQEIAVERVAYVSGDLTIWSRGDWESNHQGAETLYRAPA